MGKELLFNIEVNKKQIQARKGETILSALERNGINVPTLCHLSELSPTGACRMCVVEVEGKQGLIPSCSHTVEEWMKIKTHSPKVIRARKTLIELLLANHPDDCLYCVRNNNCGLQSLAKEHNVRERRFPGAKTPQKIDQSCSSIVFDPAKCILCGRCVRVCSEIIGVSCLEFQKRGINTSVGTALGKPINLSNCISCGQCILNCPTGALHEKENFNLVHEALHNEKFYPVVQISPSVAMAFAEEAGIKAGKEISGIINTALRKIGFHKVYDTGMANEINALAVATELSKRLENGGPFPLITSDCPAWYKYAETYYPQGSELLSKLCSPQQILAQMIRELPDKESTEDGQKVFSVSVMPCTAKKFESQREEMMTSDQQDIDAVLTTRELSKLFKLNGIDLLLCEPELEDSPYGNRSAWSKLYSISGGVAETILRTYAALFEGNSDQPMNFQKIRGLKSRKEFKIQIGKQELNVAVVSTMLQAKKLLFEIHNGKETIHLVEIMACPGGCVNGGGQPFDKDDNSIIQRIKAIYEAADKENNPGIWKNSAFGEIIERLFSGEKQASWESKFGTVYQTRNILR